MTIANEYENYLESVIMSFWRSKRPVGFTESQHIECFAVNCVTSSEKKLALAAKRIAKAKKAVKHSED